MIPSAERAFRSRPRRAKHTRGTRSPVRGAGAGASHSNEAEEPTRLIMAKLPSQNEDRAFWEPRAEVRALPAGKRQLMERFFTPLHAPQQDPVKAREHRRHVPREWQQHGQQHSQHHPNRGRYTTLEGSSGDTEQAHVLRARRSRCERPDDLRHPHPHQQQYSLDMTSHAHSLHSLDVEGSHSDTFATHSSVSSTGSSSWSSEASIDSETFLRDKRPGPQHSQSCTNIASGRQGWDEEEEVEQVFRGRGRGGDSQCQLRHTDHVPAEKDYQSNRDQPSFPKLQKGQSKSEERLLRDNELEGARSPRREHSPLYKSASLGRSLVFSNSTEILPGSRNRKKSVSSVQLPSKGILKNKEGRGQGPGGAGNFRKAKSMEVLSTRVEWTGPLPEAAKLKTEDKDQEKKKEAARNSLVQEKLQFSAFLNEITRQVISPSRLSSLGVTDVCEPIRPSPAPSFSRSSREEQKQRGRRPEEAPSQRQPRRQLDSPDSLVSGVHSQPDQHSPCSKCQRQNHTRNDTPQYQHHASGSYIDASTSPESLPAKGQGQSHRERKWHQSRSAHLRTDGASSGSELSSQLPRQPQKQVHRGAHHSPPSHTSHQAHLSSHRDSPAGNLARESDTSHSKESGSMTSPSSDQGDRHKQISRRGSIVQHKDAVCDVDRVQFLQERNEELHHSLLQTVVRMECMEAELQKTREELSILKEKFRRLQDSYSGTQETNHLLGQKLYSVVQTLDEEREHLIAQISELSMQLATARTTIFSLETINVPSLLRELLEKHFQSEETVKEFLLRCTSEQSEALTAADQSQATEKEEQLGKAEVPQRCGGQEAGAGHQRVTAFLPWKQERNRWVKSGAESGAEVSVKQQCQHLLRIPHLQFTTPPEALLNPAVEAGLTSLKNTASSLMRDTCRAPVGQLNSPIRILSTSLEEIRSPGMQLRCDQDQTRNRPSSATTKSSVPPLSSHLLKGSTVENLSDNIIPSWRICNSKTTTGMRKDNVEQSSNTVTYQVAQKMLDDFMYQLQHPAEGVGHQGEFRSWAKCPTEDILNG